MIRVLVVDDSPVDRTRAGGLLKKHGDFDVAFAQNGKEALARIPELSPDIVVTDLQMPEMDGLELVEAIRRDFPFLPVILMTAHGSEEIAVRALHKGAASYVAKRSLAQELVRTVSDVLDVTKADRNQKRLLGQLDHVESAFVLDNDTASIPALIGYLETSLSRMRLCDATGIIQVGVALREALVNAIFHGNLELGSELLEADEKAFAELAERRRREPPWCDRRVRLWARETRKEMTYIVTDEGAGFDPASLPDPTDPANLEKRSGRGLLLIRTFMDEVRHNAKGNEIVMVKRADPGHGPPSSR